MSEDTERAGDRATTPDDPKSLAIEIKRMHTELLAAAKAADGSPNGTVISYLMLRFALGDRIDRLCAALANGPEDELT